MRPDIDVEICPPGTMDAIAFAANELRGLEMFDSEMAAAGICPATPGQIADKLDAILTAHRGQLDSGPTIEQATGRTQSFFSVCENAQAARQSYVFDAQAKAQEPPKLEIDYTSETEDLSTWPQTRGPEWRRMVYGESLANGDAVNIGGPDAPWQWVDGLAGLVVVSLEAWTRRPAPEAQP